MFNRKTVEEFQAADMHADNDLQRVDGGGRVISKNGPCRKIVLRVPPDIGAGFERETEDWIEVPRLVWRAKADMSNAFCAPYALEMRPTIIKS